MDYGIVCLTKLWMLTLLIYIKHVYINFGGFKMLCSILQPTLPESETDQSVLC